MDVATAAAAAANAISNASLTSEEKARYDAARKELIQALQKKRLVDRQLAQLEVQIYNFEGSYLSETAQHSGGNIIQGFDGYLKTQSVGRRRHEPTDADRVFSNSSLSYQKSLDLLAEGADDSDAFGPPFALLNPNSTLSSNSRGPTPGLTSIVLPPPTSTTPVSQQKSHDGSSSGHQHQPLTAAQQKKMRDKEYQRRKRASAAREKERNAMIAAAAAAQAQAQAQAAAQAAGGGTSMEGIEEGGEGNSVSAVSTARGRMSKKPRQADDD
ncbi:EAF6 [Sanghuangporus sanghuang]|uniref:Chromatin modification-related protein EAF6 n=1 Tax=Sanghuangporus baumii TaxID=108892 RepID=A0A9Q5HWW1_SANBA|nr:NuA4-domain-containing protein [Sanghuangporus baumii]